MVTCMDFINTIITVLGGPENYVQSLSVIATTIMAIFAFLTIYLSRKDKQEVNRANVVAYFETEGMDTYFIVQNVGLTNAYNVKIDIDPLPLPLPQNDSRTSIFVTSVFDHEIATMLPNFKTVMYWGYGPNYWKHYEQDVPDYNIKIRYEDIYSKSHLEQYFLSFNHAKDVIFSGFSEDRYSHDSEELKKTLDKSNKHIEIIAKNTSVINKLNKK